MGKDTAALDKAIAALDLNDRKAPPGSLWRHLKSGGRYMVHGHVILEATLEPAVIYSSSLAGTPWCRSAEEFFDGRFECIDDRHG
ncbi:hypothetical protein [Pseudoruegeria sp. HB172150]|uniref:hypothetical protein n=1 Tax=Pseudoruegeria sp. HB172150 TaxID=2721164 RepID=UPI0015535ACB|nr:hypothetical protein [Pseudoruegeria sp. HB172150]